MILKFKSISWGNIYQLEEIILKASQNQNMVSQFFCVSSLSSWMSNHVLIIKYNFFLGWLIDVLFCNIPNTYITVHIISQKERKMFFCVQWCFFNFWKGIIEIKYLAKNFEIVFTEIGLFLFFWCFLKMICRSSKNFNIGTWHQ